MRVVRKAEEADHPLIYATWLRSQYYGHPWFKMIDSEAYFAAYKAFISQRLKTSNVDIICLDGDPDVILGYAVYSGPVLHWVYVKRAWRNFGIAKELVPKDITHVSSITKLGKLAGKERFKFNPFL